MVHEEVRPLLALAQAGLDKAKRLFLWRLGAHGATLAFAVIGAVAAYHSTEGGQDQKAIYEAVEIIAAVLAVGTEFAALFLHHRAVEMHSLGRRAMRRVMLLDALSPGEAAASEAEFRHHFDDGVCRQAVAALEADRERISEYYWSKKPCDEARLRDHLYESAIFSHHLYTAAWQFSSVCLLVLLVPGIAVPLLLWHRPGLLVVRVVLAMAAFLPACQELDHMLLYRLVARELSQLIKRVEALYAAPAGAIKPDPHLLAEFGDYSAATTAAPPIRTVVYRALHERLSADFEKRMEQLGQTH
jgi:hypothetical protein